MGQNGAAADSGREYPAAGAGTGDPSRGDGEGGQETLGFAHWDPLAIFNAPPGAVQGESLSNGGGPAGVPEPLVAEIVRSIAWGGDRRRGSARLTLGGRFDGAAIRIDASDGRLDVELQAPPGVDAAELLKRLGDRLRARGLVVDSLTVR